MSERWDWIDPNECRLPGCRENAVAIVSLEPLAAVEATQSVRACSAHLAAAVEGLRFDLLNGLAMIASTLAAPKAPE